MTHWNTCMVVLFALPFAKQECKPSVVTVKEPSFVVTPIGKTNLIKSVTQIAKSVLTCADPNLNLESKEAITCIDDTASRAQDSTAAGRLSHIFQLPILLERLRFRLIPVNYI